MSGGLQTDAEILKLARLLGADPGDLAFLARVDAAALRAFRDQATDRLFSADRGRLQRVAAASGKLPAQVSATIGQRVFGPLLCARVAGLLDTEHAVELARHLPPRFLAEIGVHIDPRHISDVINAMSTRRIVAVAVELARMEEHVTMGRFVGHLRDEAIRACIGVLEDETLEDVAFVIEGDGALEHVYGLVPESRRAALPRVAALLDEAA